VTEHGPGLAYRSRVGRPQQGTAARECGYIARCLCGEKFTGWASNYNKAAAKALKAREKHVAELLKNCENPHSTGVESI